MRAARALLPIAASIALGCFPPTDRRPRITSEPPWVSTYRAPALYATGRQRVLVLPFRHLDQEAADCVTESFALELEKTQALEVVSPDDPEAKRLEQIKVWENGGLEVAALTTLRRQFKVDAVALGHVTQYRPYDPPVLGLRVQVVSTRTGAVLWGAEGCFDARDSGVRAMLERFYEHRLDDADRNYGWKLLLASPRHYAQFVAHQLVATLKATRPAAMASNFELHLLREVQAPPRHNEPAPPPQRSPSEPRAATEGSEKQPAPVVISLRSTRQAKETPEP